jgi:hypothetical protein
MINCLAIVCTADLPCAFGKNARNTTRITALLPVPHTNSIVASDGKQLINASLVFYPYL